MKQIEKALIFGPPVVAIFANLRPWVVELK